MVSGTVVKEVVGPLLSKVNYKPQKYPEADLSEVCAQLVIETKICGVPRALGNPFRVD
jgi:hypothetical protein